MRIITQHVERSSQEQARGGRQISGSIETISNMVSQLNSTHKTQVRGGEQLLGAAAKMEETARAQDSALKLLLGAVERLRKAAGT